jgi:hypothetical protein
VFKPVAALGSLERKAVDQNAERTFLILLDRFNRQGRNVSEKKAAKNFAPTMFGQEDDAKSRGLKKADYPAPSSRVDVLETPTSMERGCWQLPRLSHSGK